MAQEAAARSTSQKKRQDPAEAQRAIEAALKLLEAGKAGAGRAGAERRAHRRQPAAGHHGQGAALSRHRLPAAEEAARRPSPI